MKAKIIVVAVAIIVAILVASFAALYFSSYNNIVGLNASVDEKWAQVEQELQRRYDLIPNVVTAAKAYITYEGSILENITRLRSQWMSATQSGNLDAINNATTAMESGVSALVVTFEAYPNLQASDSNTILDDYLRRHRKQNFNRTHALQRSSKRLQHSHQRFPQLTFGQPVGDLQPNLTSKHKLVQPKCLQLTSKG